jgi:hypothetical protein
MALESCGDDENDKKARSSIACQGLTLFLAGHGIPYSKSGCQLHLDEVVTLSKHDFRGKRRRWFYFSDFSSWRSFR